MRFSKFLPERQIVHIFLNLFVHVTTETVKSKYTSLCIVQLSTSDYRFD